MRPSANALNPQSPTQSAVPDLPMKGIFRGFDAAEVNKELATATAEQRVVWALQTFEHEIILTSSFGAQSAVMLHMVTRHWPEIPVVLIDTGHLFPETYQFVDQLTERLSLNLRVYQPEPGAAWIQSRHGKLWEQGVEGIEQYNKLHKVEPMQRALKQLRPAAWLAGLRREQASTRDALDLLTAQGSFWKFHPILDWSDRDVGRYLNAHKLPYHPLWEDGYVSIGDWHSTSRLSGNMTPEETRFGGLKRECGLHENDAPEYVI